MLRIVALLLNLAVSMISAGWAVVALARPATLSRSREISEGERFYARMFAARAVPFEFASGLLPLFSGGTAVLWIILAAAFIQLLDIVIAFRRRDHKMMVGAGIAAVGHLAYLLVLL